MLTAELRNCACRQALRDPEICRSTLARARREAELEHFSTQRGRQRKTWFLRRGEVKKNPRNQTEMLTYANPEHMPHADILEKYRTRRKVSEGHA